MSRYWFSLRSNNKAAPSVETAITFTDSAFISGFEKK